MDARLVPHGSPSTLQDRLAKRRNLRQKKLSTESSLSHSPSTRSLDRSSSQRANSETRATPSIQSVTSLTSSSTPSAPRKATAIRSARSELPRIQPLPVKENPVVPSPPTQPTVLPPQSPVHVQSVNTEHHKSPPIKPSVPVEQANPPQDKQPLVLPRIRDALETSPHHPSSQPQSTTDSHAHFQFPSLPSKVVPRTTSEQTLPSHRSNHSSRDRSLTHQHSLALSYVFNRRLIDTQFISSSASKLDESPQKTAWD